MIQTDIRELNERIRLESSFIDILSLEMNKVIVGQKHMVDSLLIGLLSNGHILLEGVPGLAKTLAITSLSKAIDAKFSRIQFTPDLLPADLIGTLIYSQKKEEFQIKKGPIFANFVLADEINRSPAKVQSALLESMQEHQVTIGDETFPLPDPFLVMATQNPIEQEGTYQLPEAQVDRFMLKIIIDYPDKTQELEILKKSELQTPEKINSVINADELRQMSEIIRQIYIDDKLKEYIVDIVNASRQPEKYGIKIADYIEYGASPRATIFLAQASKVTAFLQGRAYVTPQDIKTIAFDVLRHRILLSFEAEAEDVTPDEIINALFDSVEIP